MPAITIFATTFPYFFLVFCYYTIVYKLEEVANSLDLDPLILDQYILPSILVFIYHLQKAFSIIPRIYNETLRHFDTSEKKPLSEKKALTEEKKISYLPAVTRREYIVELIPTATIFTVYLLNNYFSKKIAKALKASENTETGVYNLLFITAIYLFFDITKFSDRLHNWRLEPNKRVNVSPIKYRLVSVIPVTIMMLMLAVADYFTQDIANVFSVSSKEVARFWLPLASTLFYLPFAYLSLGERIGNKILKWFNINEKVKNPIHRHSFGSYIRVC